MTARVLIRKLRERGYDPMRQRGSHQIWRCTSCQTVIPVYAGDRPRARSAPSNATSSHASAPNG